MPSSTSRCGTPHPPAAQNITSCATPGQFRIIPAAKASTARVTTICRIGGSPRCPAYTPRLMAWIGGCTSSGSGQT